MVVGIPMMIFAADIWGSEGVAGARLATTLITIPVIVYSERRFLGEVQWRFWCAVGVRIAAAITLTVLIQEVALVLLGQSFAGLLVAGITGGLIFVGALLLAGFVTDDDKEMLRWAFMRRAPVVAETTD